MDKDIFRLEPWNPEVIKAAENLISQIHEAAPELEVLFMGAAALGLPGKNDIDLDILCDAPKVHFYSKVLVPILGTPKSAKDNLASWEFERGGFEVDCMLSDPKVSHVRLQRKRFEILKASTALRNEYVRLKEACDGLPFSEYEKQKVAFLEEKVLSSNAIDPQK